MTVLTELKEPMAVYVDRDSAVAFVQGREDWIETGTAGEFRTRIDLRRTPNGWSVVRTDEVTLSEWHGR